jgi:murein tripeptide amidase MpaA
MKPAPKRSRRAAFAWLVLVLACGPVFSSLPETAREKDIVSVARTPRIAARLQPLGLDLLFEWEGRVYVLAGPRDLHKLDLNHIPYLVESHRFPALTSRQAFLQGGINGDYHSYLELESGLQDLERSFPQLARLFTIGASLENRKIYALKVSDNVGQDESEPEVLFLGCHHAREWISVEVPFLLARYLLEQYATDERVRRLVDGSEVWIVPLVNPDGLEYSVRFYRYWRKNRRLNADGSFGVDLNRNYDYGWAYDDEGSSPIPASEVYRGASPFSEPETRAVRDLFGERQFRALITYHSFSQVILFPWGYTTDPTDQEPLHRSLAGQMSALMAAVNGRVYGFGAGAAQLYLTNGDTTDWAFGVAGIPAFTIELPPVDLLEGGFFNAEVDIDPIFEENLPAALFLIDWASGESAATRARVREPRLELSGGWRKDARRDPNQKN